MNWEQVGVLVTAAGVLVAIVGRAVGVWLNNRNARRHRISKVVDEYVRLSTASPPEAIGPRAFVRAGARLLKDDAEVREAIRQIAARVGKIRHPLGGYRRDLPEDVNLKRDVVDRLDDDGRNLREIFEHLT